MHLLHMTGDFNKFRGEGFCLGKESSRHSMLLMRECQSKIQNPKSKIARHQSGISSGSESDRYCDSCSLGNSTAGNSCSTPGYVSFTAAAYR